MEFTEFTVYDDDGEEHEYLDDSTYAIEHGVLTVWDAKARRRVIYGPAGWLRLEVEDVDVSLGTGGSK
jgi:hypothetical protein